MIRLHAVANSAARYNILIDQTVVGTVADEQSQTFAVPPGPHVVLAKVNWCRSPAVEVVVPPGRDVRLVCRAGANVLDGLYKMTFGYKRYIELDHEFG